MKRLLRTEALIWWDADDRRLGKRARAAIHVATDVCRAASAWEIVIKQNLQIETTRESGRAAAEAGFNALPVTFEHAAAVRPCASSRSVRSPIIAAFVEDSDRHERRAIHRHNVPLVDARH
jgi:PIN domain nuclease of toxin-antitoxin system